MAPRPLFIALAGTAAAAALYFVYKPQTPPPVSPRSDSKPQDTSSPNEATTTKLTTAKSSPSPAFEPPAPPAPTPVSSSPSPLSDVTNSSVDSTSTCNQVAKKRYNLSRGLLHSTRQTIHFAAGCFWSVQLAFDRVTGVTATRVGYTQGSTADPNYDTVKTGKTGHVEAVEVTYDPSLVTLSDLMIVFWNKHDPKTKNRQGNDKGTQYRSGVYYTNDSQKSVILESVKEEKKKLAKPWHKIHTEIKPASAFYPAETMHQRYLERGGRHGRKQSAAKGCSDPIRCYG